MLEFITFIGSIALFLAGSALKARRPVDFLVTDRRRLLPVNLVASNLNVSGSLFALSSLTATHGIYAALGFVSIFVGMLLFYLVYSAALRSSVAFPLARGGADTSARPVSAQVRSFAKVFALSIALVAMFAMGWEIYVGSSAVEFILERSAAPVQLSAFQIGLVIAGTMALYSARGGYSYVVLSDTVQLCIVVIFVSILSYFYILPALGAGTRPAETVIVPPLSAGAIALFAATMLVVSVSDQIQSPGNWLLAKSAKNAKSLKRIFIIGICCLACVWAVILAVHLLSHMRRQAGAETWLSLLDVGNDYCRAIFVSGLTCLILASADSILLGSFNLLHDAFDDGHNGSPARRRARTYLFAGYVITVCVTAFCVSYLMITSAPDVFFSMLGIGGVLCVYTPAFLTFLFGDRLPLTISRPRLIWLLSYFFLASALQLFLSLHHMNGAVLPLILSSFVAGVFIATDFDQLKQYALRLIRARRE